MISLGLRTFGFGGRIVGLTGCLLLSSFRGSIVLGDLLGEHLERNSDRSFGCREKVHYSWAVGQLVGRLRVDWSLGKTGSNLGSTWLKQWCSKLRQMKPAKDMELKNDSSQVHGKRGLIYAECR